MQGEAGIDGSQAETLHCGEVRGEGERGQIRRRLDLPLQRSDGCGVGADVRGVLGGGFER